MDLAMVKPTAKDPNLVIDIQSSKFEVKSKDASRLMKLGQEYMFSKILESKSDLNFKIAKVITNAVGWELDFSAFRQGKQTFKVPARKYAGGAQTIQPEEKFIDIKPQTPALPDREEKEEEEEKESPALNLPQLQHQVDSVDLDAMPERVKRNEKKKDQWAKLVEKQKTQQVELQ